MMITAHLRNDATTHEVRVDTAGRSQRLAVSVKADGRGSTVNGGEFLMLALATCYCNDLHREATRLGLALEAVEVEASADFDGIGLAARNVRYRAHVQCAAASPQQIERLLSQTDALAEVHNTLRAGCPVTRQPWSD